MTLEQFIEQYDELSKKEMTEYFNKFEVQD